MNPKDAYHWRSAAAPVVAMVVPWAITLIGLWVMYAWQSRWELTGGFCASYGNQPMRCGQDYYAWDVSTFPIRVALPLAFAVALFSPLGCTLGHVLARNGSIMLHLVAFALLGFTLGALWWLIMGSWFTIGGPGFSLLLAGAVPIGWAVAQQLERHGESRRAQPADS
jgi:hypothetical protein